MDVKKQATEFSCEKLFEKYDTDKDGFISVEELLKAAEHCPEWQKTGISKAKIEECLKRWDKNNDHKLSCDEFSKMMTEVHCEKGNCDKVTKICDGDKDAACCDKNGVCDKNAQACDKTQASKMNANCCDMNAKACCDKTQSAKMNACCDMNAKACDMNANVCDKSSKVCDKGACDRTTDTDKSRDSMDRTANVSAPRV